jgi:hypothetical protein
MNQMASIETVAEYWNRRPCNIRHSRAEVGSRAYFDEVEERKYFVEPHIPAFAQFDRWKDKRVLEIGSGCGYAAAVLAVRRSGGAAALDAVVAAAARDAAAASRVWLAGLAAGGWELDTLRRHYSPAVSRFVTVLDRDLSNRMVTADVDIAALANASYASLFAEEAERRLKAVPLAFYPEQTPRALWEDGWQPNTA